jgi:FkbM family methyltransferase
MKMHLFEKWIFTGEWPLKLLDVGAQIGEFSQAFVKQFPMCQPMLIEANPACEPFLKQTGFPYHIVAASNRRGNAPFYVSKENPSSTGNSLYREQTSHFSDEKTKIIEVPLTTLDELFPDEIFDFIKVDVQGAELDVLLGARKLLSRSSAVLLELSFAEYNEKAPLADRIIQEMRNLGYRLEDALEFHRIKDVFDGGIFQTDFLFVPIVPRRSSQRALLAADGTRQPLLNFLTHMRQLHPHFKVIDIGANANNWSWNVVDATFDREKNSASSYQFVGDLNRESDWTQVLDYVAEHGRFHYAICSHTLEDLANPDITLRNLGLIAEAGFISVPALQTELTSVEQGPWLGYIHHRWLIDYQSQEQKMIFYPKLPFLEHLDLQKNNLPNDRFELQVFWRGRPHYSLANDGYMGPNVESVINLFTKQLLDQKSNPKGRI